MVRSLSSGRRLAAALGLAAGFVAYVLFLTEVARHTRYGNSDNANALLAGEAMLRGNPLLRDWVLPTNSYWLIDLPMMGIASVLFGMRELLVHAVAAVVTTTTMVVGAMVARMGRPVRSWWVGAGVLLILLGLPHLYLVIFILHGPHHLATALFCLIAFALLSGGRLGDLRWVAATGLLAVTVHSDPVAIAIGVVPVAAAGLLDGLRTRRFAALAAPLAAAAGAMAGSLFLAFLLDQIGGYSYRADNPPYIKAWPQNLRATPTVLGGLLGVLTHGGLKGVAKVVHHVGALLFAAALLVTLIRSAAGLVRPSARPASVASVRLWRPTPAWLDDVLLIGCVGGVAVFALLTVPLDQRLNARYLLPSLVFGAVLTARRAIEASDRIPAPAVAGTMLALGAAYLMTPLGTLGQPVPVNPSVAVVDWLEARGLHRGYGQYWVAGITTVTGRELVAVRPVANVGGVLRPNVGFASRRWFEDARPFRFVILNSARPDGVDEQVAVATFGAPVEAHDIGQYRVLVWDRDLRVRLDP